MRLAAQTEVLDALASHIAGASSSPAERGQQVARMERLAELMTQLRSGGLSEQAALLQGLRIVDGQEPAPPFTLRFANIHGDPS